MMKMRIAAVLAAVMIGSAAMPTVTAFAYGNDPAQTTAAESTEAESTEAGTTAAETESIKETSALCRIRHSADYTEVETMPKNSSRDSTYKESQLKTSA